jgi:hypothetical protein
LRHRGACRFRQGYQMGKGNAHDEDRGAVHSARR